MIPKIIHYCWFGESAIPDEYQAYIKEWKKLNPQFKIMKWDEKNSPLTIPYLKTAIANKNWANASNLVRFLALQEHGGIYMDTDMKLIKPLDELLKNECFFGFQEGDKDSALFWVNNAIMGAVPHHKFIEFCANSIIKKFDGTEAANLSAPHIVTELLKKQYKLKSYGFQKLGDITLYPKEVFYPIHYDEALKVKEYKKYITDATIGVHVWARTWFSRETMLDLIDNYQQGNKELQQLLQTANKESESKNAQLTSYLEKISAFENEIDLNKNSITELHTISEDLKTSLTESEEDLKDLRNNNIRLFDRQIELLDKIIEKEETVKTYEVSVNVLENDITNKELLIEQKELRITESNKTIDLLINEINSLKLEVLNHSKIFTKKDESIKALQVELKNENLQAYNQKEKIAALNAELKNANNILQDKKVIIEVLEKEKANDKQQILTLQKEASLLTNKLEKLSEDLGEKKKNLLNATKEIETLEQDLNTERSKASTIATELILLKQIEEQQRLKLLENIKTVNALDTERKKIEYHLTQKEVLLESLSADCKKQAEDLKTLNEKMKVSDYQLMQKDNLIQSLSSECKKQADSISHYEKLLSEQIVLKEEYVEKVSWYSNQYENKNFFQLIVSVLKQKKSK
jgi:DNA repair exonuclease SbcCD ATPase subunit